MARSGGFWAGVVFGGAALGAVVATGYFVSTYSPVIHDNMCTVTLDGETWARTSEQANNAALVAAGAARLDLGTQASTVGVATAIQESSLRNLDYGDRDSLGLFQQRPSQGWGTEAEIMNPHYATVKFYSRLVNVDGWEDMRVTDAAQAVQSSGFPEAYEKHAPEAAAWAAAIRGDEPFGAVNCDLEAVAAPSTAIAFADRIAADFGDDMYEVVVLGRNDRAALLGVTATSGSAQETAGLANWAVAVSDPEAVASVRLGEVQWLREQGIGEALDAAGFDGVLIGIVESVPAD
jgi:hypothetical protein